MKEKNRIILLADDDIDDLELLTEILLQHDSSLKVLTASTGSSAVTLLRNATQDQLPGLLVIDYNMPDMTGAAVLKQISNDPRYTSIPKVVWSTSDSSLYEQICKTNGATHYFKKPDNLDDIILFAKKILTLHV